MSNSIVEVSNNLSQNLSVAGDAVVPTKIEAKLKIEKLLELADTYYYGRGVPKDYQKAFLLYKLGVRFGDSKAQTNLGAMYCLGEGVNIDYNTSFALFKAAAEQGNFFGQLNLGIMYDNGHGVKKDKKIAHDIFIKSIERLRQNAESGEVLAQNFLGAVYANGSFGVAIDDKKAVELFKLAAKQNNANAQNNLGYMYMNGRGVEKDEKIAYELFRQAATQGQADAQFYLGSMHEHGKGIKKDEKIASEHYKQAADQGYSDAQIKLAVMYQDGKGVVKDEKRSLEFYSLAAEQGNFDAQDTLVHRYEKGNLNLIYEYGVIQSYKIEAINGNQEAQNRLKSIFYKYEPAASAGNPIALYMLGRMYENGFGFGIGKDKKRAFDLYMQAAQKGNEKARDRLKLWWPSFVTLFNPLVPSPHIIHRILQSEHLETVETLLMTLFQNLPSPKPIDLRAVSFICIQGKLNSYLSEILTVYQPVLRQLGAIFTLSEFKKDFEAYLYDFTMEDHKRYLAQMNSNINLIFDTWRKGLLKNKLAVKQLDNYAIALLKKLLDLNNNMLLTENKEKLLKNYFIKVLLEQKQSDYIRWSENESKAALDVEESENLENWLSQRIYEQWDEQSTNFILEDKVKTQLIIHLNKNLLMHVYSKLKTGSLPYNLSWLILEKIRKQLLKMQNSPHLIDIILEPVYQVLVDNRRNLFHLDILDNEVSEREKKIFEIDQFALESVITQWMNNELSQQAETGMLHLVEKIIGEKEFIDEKLKESLMKESIAAFITHYKRNSKIADKEFDTLRLGIKSIIEYHPEPTEMQLRKVYKTILWDWKKMALTQDLQLLLEAVFFEKWDRYRNRFESDILENAIIKLKQEQKLKHETISVLKEQIQLLEQAYQQAPGLIGAKAKLPPIIFSINASPPSSSRLCSVENHLQETPVSRVNPESLSNSPL